MLNKLQQNGERCTSFIAAVNSAVSRWLTARDWNISLLFTFLDARDSEFSRKDSCRESEQLHFARSCRKRGEKYIHIVQVWRIVTSSFARATKLFSRVVCWCWHPLKCALRILRLFHRAISPRPPLNAHPTKTWAKYIAPVRCIACELNPYTILTKLTRWDKLLP